MTKDESKILDWRSTGRRKARRALYASYIPYACVGHRAKDVNGKPIPGGGRIVCGKTTKEPPKDAPAWFEEIWPKTQRVLDSQLQADHETKDWQNNEVENVNWKCPSCHRIDDMATGVGEAQVNRSLF